MGNEYHVNFIGPFSWLGHDGTKAIFDTPEGNLCGIYLWTVNINEGELVNYVGKTNRSFSQRMREHFEKHLAGSYHVYSVEEFKRGERVAIWDGMNGHKKPRPDSLAEIYPSISQHIIDLAKTYRFFIAPLKAEVRILERIECALAKHLYKQPGKIGNFQEPNLRYRSRLKLEQPATALFSSSTKILGLPELLEI